MPATAYSCKRVWFLIAIGLALASSQVNSSPFPLEASIAYVEELALTCTKVQGNSSAAYFARRDFLFSKAPEQVKKIQAASDYPALRKWAQDAIAQEDQASLADECALFLTKSDLAFSSQEH